MNVTPNLLLTSVLLAYSVGLFHSSHRLMKAALSMFFLVWSSLLCLAIYLCFLSASLCFVQSLIPSAPNQIVFFLLPSSWYISAFSFLPFAVPLLSLIFISMLREYIDLRPTVLTALALEPLLQLLLLVEHMSLMCHAYPPHAIQHEP